MYHWIVERKVRRTFAALSTGDAGPMLAALAPRFTYRFYGQHALAGTRHSPEAMRLWWERVYRLFPTIGFEADEVLVRGWPWRTRISTIATVRAELPDGGAYENDMHQFMLLRWGAITEIRTMEDTQHLACTLAKIARDGVAEAGTAPVSD